MATGIIARLHSDRGFGFIASDDTAESGDLFFHHTAVADQGFDQLAEGQRVTFQAGPDPRDPRRRRANDVRPE
ncbi:MAG: cold-shock protein [Chloroflexota bacterium]